MTIELHEPTDPPINRFGTHLNDEYMAPSCAHQIEPCCSNACCCTCHADTDTQTAWEEGFYFARQNPSPLAASHAPNPYREAK